MIQFNVQVFDREVKLWTTPRRCVATAFCGVGISAGIKSSGPLPPKKILTRRISRNLPGTCLRNTMSDAAPVETACRHEDEPSVSLREEHSERSSEHATKDDVIVLPADLMKPESGIEVLYIRVARAHFDVNSMAPISLECCNHAGEKSLRQRAVVNVREQRHHEYRWILWIRCPGRRRCRVKSRNYFARPARQSPVH